jgi:hypothetical protein
MRDPRTGQYLEFATDFDAEVDFDFCVVCAEAAAAYFLPLPELKAKCDADPAYKSGVVACGNVIMKVAVKTFVPERTDWENIYESAYTVCRSWAGRPAISVGVSRLVGFVYTMLSLGWSSTTQCGRQRPRHHRHIDGTVALLR